MRDPGMFWAAFAAAWVFGCAIVLIVIWHLRSKRNLEKMQIAHEERMKAMEKGIPLPEFPAIKDENEMEKFKLIFERPNLNPRWPLGLGAICIMIGAGIMVAFLLSADHELWKLWSMGLLGVFFGFGLVLYYYLTRTPEQK